MVAGIKLLEAARRKCLNWEQKSRVKEAARSLRKGTFNKGSIEDFQQRKDMEEHIKDINGFRSISRDIYPRLLFPTPSLVPTETAVRV